MKALVSTLGICAMALFAVGGCGSDDDGGGGGGSGGGTGGSGGGSTGGSGGSGGGSTGGTAGSATGGTAGSATGGTAGSATGGTAGAAGGGGGDLTCANYCSTIAANCTEANSQYDNEGDCMSACNGWPEGTLGDTTGATLACHLYHAQQAADNAGLHCPHAGPTGGGPGGPCAG